VIGFWYQRPSRNAAAIKAFVVTGSGDFGFALGHCILYVSRFNRLRDIFAVSAGPHRQDH